MTTKTKTVTTAEGEFEYETVECSSCGNDVAKKGATKVVMIHDLEDKRSGYGYTEFKAKEYSEGWACEYCTDEPIGFPARSKISKAFDDLKSITGSNDMEEVLMKLVVVMLVVWLFLFTIFVVGNMILEVIPL
jgi:hypothetical protein